MLLSSHSLLCLSRSSILVKMQLSTPFLLPYLQHPENVLATSWGFISIRSLKNDRWLMCRIMQLCRVYLEFFISSRMSRVTGDSMGETRSYQFVRSGSDVLCAFELCLCSAWAPAAPKCNILKALTSPRPLGSCSEPRDFLSAVSLTSIGSNFLEYLGLIMETIPRNSYLKCMVFLMSVQDYSPPHKSCGCIQSVEFSVCWGKILLFQK